MDMDEVLSVLYEMATPDEAARAARRRATKAAEPYYARLRETLGEAGAEAAWAAAMGIGAVEEQSAFRAGLCLGLRLMALNL